MGKIHAGEGCGSEESDVSVIRVHIFERTARYSSILSVRNAGGESQFPRKISLLSYSQSKPL